MPYHRFPEELPKGALALALVKDVSHAFGIKSFNNTVHNEVPDLPREPYLSDVFGCFLWCESAHGQLVEHSHLEQNE